MAKEKASSVTKHMPQSLEVTKHMFHEHLSQHFQAPPEVLNQLSVIAEIHCDCGAGNSILVCAVCRDILVARVHDDNICICLRGLLDG